MDQGDLGSGRPDKVVPQVETSPASQVSVQSGQGVGPSPSPSQVQPNQYDQDYQQGYDSVSSQGQSGQNLQGGGQPVTEKAGPNTRPEWFPEHFWDGSKDRPDIRGLIDGYTKLQQQFDNTSFDMPAKEISEYTTPEFQSYVDSLGLSSDDMALNMALESALGSDMSVKQTHKFVDQFMTRLNEVAPPVNLDKELKNLGPNGRQLVGNIRGWLDGMKATGKMDEGIYNTALSLGASADGIRLLDMLRGSRMEPSIPTQATRSDGGMSLQDWYKKSYSKDKRPDEAEEQFDERMKADLEKIMRTLNTTDLNLGNYSV
mmetsp:Transcript_6118/g.3462  ORF Transcript_6118/g.3462 Transcript_6118/m.3462 type:complete len:316 (-) Transcript_6118:57-1004(-)